MLLHHIEYHTDKTMLLVQQKIVVKLMKLLILMAVLPLHILDSDICFWFANQTTLLCRLPHRTEMCLDHLVSRVPTRKLSLVEFPGWSRALIWAWVELCQGAKFSKLFTTQNNWFLLFFIQVLTEIPSIYCVNMFWLNIQLAKELQMAVFIFYKKH